MNINGMARSMLNRQLKGEDFLKYVANVIERQLKEWDEEYEVIIIKLANYEWTIKKNDHYYHVALTEQELKVLQEKGLYALDRMIWVELKKQGLPIIRGKGNYLDSVL